MFDYSKKSIKVGALIQMVLILIIGTVAQNNHVFAAPSSDYFRFVAYGDTRSQPDVHRKVISYIITLKPEFVLQSGDLVDKGADPSQWAEFDGIVAPLHAAHIAYYPARGNHDVGPYYIKRVTEKYDSGNGYYYSFQRHGIKFVAVDNFEPFDPESDQYKWLESQLQSTKVQTVIVFFHESPYSIGPHGSNFDVQKTLVPLFVKYHVPLVFCGHDHLYYRTIRNGVTYMVTGGGGAPLYDPVNLQYSIPGDVYKKTYHVIQCDVSAKTIDMTVFTPDGEVIDKLSVKR